MSEALPKKLYYKIGEVCDLCEIQPHVLRYWETEFAQLAPTKNTSGQRMYRYKDVLLVRRIKQLLYDEGYTIAGAGKKLSSENVDESEPAGERSTAAAGDSKASVLPLFARKPSAANAETPSPDDLESIERDLRGLLDILKDD